MSTVQLSVWVMLVFGGLWAGGILIFAVERTNLWRRMPMDQFSVDFRRSVLRVDPMMPILGGISGISALSVAILSDGGVRYLAGASVFLMALVIVGSVVIAEPMNTQFRKLPEGQIPENALKMRDNWRVFHLVRTIVAIATLACMAATASV
ncbi:protein of unknown function [Sphingobium sp. AP50]|uniref:anthrone oxygenase family protein n=1 Tax=Sphingobium sp. AP50 TaxID=1884369 RepID=UPI0008B185BE|nr:DUF1772 domain-containing protein [Sphingobium sp. AP50]SEJ98898.1 protein of unknown function [Sphingobium sp. AP50]